MINFEAELDKDANTQSTTNACNAMIENCMVGHKDA